MLKNCAKHVCLLYLPEVATQKKSPKKVLKTNNQLMQVKYCRMLPWSILQYFWPALSYHMAFRPLFCLFLSGRLRRFSLYFLYTCIFILILVIVYKILLVSCSVIVWGPKAKVKYCIDSAMRWGFPAHRINRIYHWRSVEKEKIQPEGTVGNWVSGGSLLDSWPEGWSVKWCQKHSCCY